MEAIELNRCLCAQTKYYGLGVIGIITGAMAGMVGLIIFNLLVGAVGMIVGYLTGDYLSKLYRKGYLQRLVYAQLPTFGKSLPKSHQTWYC